MNLSYIVPIPAAVCYHDGMEITYPSAHKWVEQLTNDPLEHLGKNNRARLRSTLNKMDDTNIRYEVAPLTREIIDWFTPLYQDTIGQKQNGKVFDIYGSTLGKQSSVPYFALLLYEDDEPVGATIFSERKTILSIAYRIYPHKWSSHKLQANPSLYTEYVIRQHACEQGYHQLTHGKDRNPYGVNSNIGLALFKLSVGCNIFLPTAHYEVHTGDLFDFTEDVLVFLQPTTDDTDRITRGILYASEAGLKKYKSLTTYSESVAIEAVLRQDT